MILTFGSCTSEEANLNTLTKPPNIIWLVAEDISPSLGCYGDTLATTPNIDRLANSGVVYNKAYATAPICAPSRSCLVTGLYATSMGSQHLRCEITLPKLLQTLPEQLQKEGYFTSNRNKTDYNFDPQNLWEHWSGSLAPWRNRKKDQPFFSFINVGPSHEGSVNRLDSYQRHTKDLPENQFTDPNAITVPPYYPDTEATREVWAHYYDILKVLDGTVGQVLDSLEADGLFDETIIFFFGDHGFGMPRYKRWLYNTGLNVPLVIHVPKQYEAYAQVQQGTVNDNLISFVDFVPTVLNLSGASLPEYLEGRPFLGPQLPSPRRAIYGARDRADDMFEMSRAIVTDQYIYIKHFMPHLPYIQTGYIYSDVKESFKALRQARKKGINDAEQEKMWNPKPREELYDLKADPKEINNLAYVTRYQTIKEDLKSKLFSWMIDHKDTGLLPEAEYMHRAGDSSAYEYARSLSFKADQILAVADLVGSNKINQLINHTEAEDSGIRFWATVGLCNLPTQSTNTLTRLNQLLKDPSPSVQIQAAETICRFQENEEAVQVLGKWVRDDRPWVALQAARSIQLIGENARPLIPILYQVLEKNLAPPGGKRKYKDFNFAAFTSWALEWTLQELGETIKVN